MPLPQLTQARAPLTRAIEVINEHGARETISIPAERDLTVYVDKRELVTLMTLGAHPEWLVLGYLLNQRLIASVNEVESITVDWEVNAASVKTRQGIDRIEERTSRRVVTTGCGQGSVFGHLMDEIDTIRLPAEAGLKQSELYAIVNAIRLKESTYKSAGSVHACALFHGEALQLFVEDVGRHNAVDTIAGWMAMNPAPTLDRSNGSQSSSEKIFYTTGRLTSEMVIKSAQMGVAVVISRSGITQMGLDVAERVGLCAIGRATHQRFLCYANPQRLELDAIPSAAPVARERAASPS
ncbi:MAG: formate dehydrogenase accessory sulfurtransferase FdhD [Hydrogenophaga sp.]|jgi:FdhD protein|uniref:formate dehydrogenase accessory sulfurtransferase FdhD n=1 Tax=Hydrogenophaga sp. TaxID=1904254 RepID=UPI001DE97C2A|nr:formate dehydrogenase accessory sulfurtransferase FdhD [Hydrogenophaga sp.]MBW0171947.1 formate dehydrogenase accessory sulfurtransferase FdhD [Hydrogenophaga sp.]MBW0184776.1 formate dehydrogenase accessory sulfurtransferase FdhD [Hydrogenophaga sp.]